MISEGKREDVLNVFTSVAETCDRLAIAVKSHSESREVVEISIRLSETAKLAKRERDGIGQPFRLGVIGMFKSGKSSVINTFLDRVILKEGRTETTSVLTELCFAENPEAETARIVYRDGTSHELTVPKALEYTDIRSECFRGLSLDKRHELQSSIERIILSLHCEFLRTVTLLDTPGFGGSQVGDQKAFEALVKVDAALMIFSADRVGAENELAVADFLTRHSREIVVLLNKIDNGQGDMRCSKDLDAAESFIKENFRTVVTDSNDEPLIFRYSAKHVWKALESSRQAGLSKQQAAAIEGELCRWGYLGATETEGGKGVRAFIRDRYFSSSSGAPYARKLEAGRTSLLNVLVPLTGAIADAEKQAHSEATEDKSEAAKQRTQLNQEIGQKTLHVESKIEEMISGHVQPFVRDLEDAINTMIEKQTDMDVAALFKAFRKKETIAKEIEREFRDIFPSRHEEALQREIERKLSRLLQTEWMYMFGSLQQINAAVKIPDATALLQQVNNAVRGAAIALAGSLAGWIALVFVPGGAVVGGILMLLSDLVGFHFGSKHGNKLREVKDKIRVQLRNYAKDLNDKLGASARQANDRLAALARDSATANIDAIDNNAQNKQKLAELWRTTHRDLNAHRQILADIQISIDPS